MHVPNFGGCQGRRTGVAVTAVSNSLILDLRIYLMKEAGCTQLTHSAMILCRIRDFSKCLVKSDKQKRMLVKGKMKQGLVFSVWYFVIQPHIFMLVKRLVLQIRLTSCNRLCFISLKSNRILKTQFIRR